MLSHERHAGGMMHGRTRAGIGAACCWHCWCWSDRPGRAAPSTTKATASSSPPERRVRPGPQGCSRRARCAVSIPATARWPGSPTTSAIPTCIRRSISGRRRPGAACSGPDCSGPRLLSVLFSLVALAGVATLAMLCGVPPVAAILLTLGCYGFTYTGSIARGFALGPALHDLGHGAGGAGRHRGADRTRCGDRLRRRRSARPGRLLELSGSLRRCGGPALAAAHPDRATGCAGLRPASALPACCRRTCIFSWPSAAAGSASSRRSGCCRAWAASANTPPPTCSAACRSMSGGSPAWSWARCWCWRLPPCSPWSSCAGVASRPRRCACCWRWPAWRPRSGCSCSASCSTTRRSSCAISPSPPPFFAVLLAGAFASLPGRIGIVCLCLLLCVQALSLAGMMTRPETMQPQAQAARAVRRLAAPGSLALVPYGNDGRRGAGRIRQRIGRQPGDRARRSWRVHRRDPGRRVPGDPRAAGAAGPGRGQPGGARADAGAPSGTIPASGRRAPASTYWRSTASPAARRRALRHSERAPTQKQGTQRQCPT